MTALWLLALQGIFGAFDTIYYHEWKAKLPALGKQVANELRLHAARDVLYALLFLGLALFEWRGSWVVALGAILLAEIIFTMWDFIVEAVVRKPLGDVYPGERVTHAVMGILYGAMLVFLLSRLQEWYALPTELVHAGVPEPLRSMLIVMGAGVFLSGVRDVLASMELPGCQWPWRRETQI